MLRNSSRRLSAKSVVVLTTLSLFVLQACADRRELLVRQAIHVHVSTDSFIVNGTRCDSYAHVRDVVLSVRDDATAVNMTVAPGVERTRINAAKDIILATGLTLPILLTENSSYLFFDDSPQYR